MNSTGNGGRTDPPAAVLIGPGNALEVTGAPWHYWRRHAAELGIRIVEAGSKRFIIAAELVVALEKRAEKPVEEVDDLEAFRERVRRAG